MTRPVVGVCAAVEQIRWGAWDTVANLSPRSYTDAIQSAGGMGLILPPDDTAAEAPGQLLDLLDQGLNNEQVADRLSLSVPTVKWHLHNVYVKLGVRSRSAALARARTLNLIGR